MRTFHYRLHVVDQAINSIESLSNGQLGLLERQSIQTLKNCFNVLLPQKLSCIFLCNQSVMGGHQEGCHSLLNRPWLICFVAKASTTNSSTMILTITSVIAGVGWMSI